MLRDQCFRRPSGYYTSRVAGTVHARETRSCHCGVLRSMSRTAAHGSWLSDSSHRLDPKCMLKGRSDGSRLSLFFAHLGAFPLKKSVVTRSDPFVETDIVPRSPVIITAAPLADHLSTTSLCGCPNTEDRPTEMIANFAR